MDSLGKPYAILLPSQYPLNKASTKQLETVNQNLAIEFIKELITAKMKNQLNLIKYFYKTSKNKLPNEIFSEEMKRMNEIIEKVNTPVFIEGKIKDGDLNKFRDKILGYEGSFATAYWRLFSFFIPENYGFKEREHKNATNGVNILLNYGYGVLYTKILKSITLAGLNPQIGFLHRPAEGKPALVFDLIEPFRAPVVDRAVIAFLSRNKNLTINQKTFGKNVKTKFLKKLFARLESNFYHRGKLTNFEKLINQQAKDVADFILNEKTKMKFFVSKW